jgi:hypothetical protein
MVFRTIDAQCQNVCTQEAREKRWREGLAAFLIDDVTRGYNLPPPLDRVCDLPGISLQLMGDTLQNTISEHKT